MMNLVVLLLHMTWVLAFIFQHSQGNDDEMVGVVQYVEILKENLQLEYGPMFSPIALFPCK
jgi:hypothetical protein